MKNICLFYFSKCREKIQGIKGKFGEKTPVFAYTKHSCMLLEKVAVAVAKKEPVLLVGETGTGKTSVVQYLAHVTRKLYIFI